MKQRLIVSGLAWLAAIILVGLGMLDYPHAFQLASCLTVLALVWPADSSVRPVLPSPPYYSHDGARSEVARLSWAIVYHDGRVADRVVTRLRAIAADNPALLRQIDITSVPRISDVNHWLDCLSHQPEKEAHDKH